ncbi:AMP-binding protein [Thiocapsa marina]|uniref:O-succinylbenzoate--CoA ligase n=1 Tax=Thiocapsa marina 5811 TaxID=768671 RepID=F9U7K6_9GAMM|nr:AMP-binding protein [Thiocapsa marina]EGV19636.1 o-succinylbenzoate--CoA ligase [Thiocapsa marina 5811]
MDILDLRLPSQPDSAYRAVLVGGERWDGSMLDARIRQRASFLQARGLEPGHVVLCPDGPVLDVLLMSSAAARLGVAVFPFRAGLGRAELDVLAVATGTEWRWQPESGDLVSTGVLSAAMIPQETPVARLVKTSGSSGQPKVVMLSAKNLQVSAAAVNRQLGFGVDDVWLCCLRLSHVGGSAILDRTALAGASLVLHERFDAQTLAEDLRRHAVTHISLVPPMLDRLLDVGATPPKSLRVLLVGGQVLSPALAERALAAGWPLYLTYGMTETASQIATSARALERVCVDGSIGPLLSGVEIASGPPATSPARLRVRGPMVMIGYANPQRLPGRGLDDGWFETSDLGGVGVDGELRVGGRADEVLVIGGTNVSLSRVEAVLCQAPGVAEVVVVALDDPVWGHRMVAIYRGKPDEPALCSWCEQALSGAERPREFRRVAELPLLDSGKYDRSLIRAMAQTASKA